MQKRLLLTLGVLLSSSLPTGAQQTRPAQLRFLQERPTPRMTLLSAASNPLPVSTFLPTPRLAESPPRLTALLAAVYNRDRSPEHLSSVEVVKTPFVSQTRLKLVQLWSGRLQLAGVARTSQMANVLLGFPGSGRLGCPGMSLPRASRSYGFNLTFRLGHDDKARAATVRR